MDAILDSNIYLQLIVSNGRDFAETNRFVELIAYLRRTNSQLVIPICTFYEIVERYRDRLRIKAKEAEGEWEELRRISMSDIGAFRAPDISGETERLRELLRGPASGFHSNIYAEYSGVDVSELVRRGIKRIRPASDKGEELRDVILWFVTLDYGRKTGRPIALISNDHAFVDAEGKNLHPTLAEDVSGSGISLKFYRSIAEFLAAYLLRSELLEAEYLSRFVPDAQLRGIATEKLLMLRLQRGKISELEVRQLNLHDGHKYAVDENSFYLEAYLRGSAVATVVEQIWSYVPEPTIQAPTVLYGNITNIQSPLWGAYRPSLVQPQLNVGNVTVGPIAAFTAMGTTYFGSTFTGGNVQMQPSEETARYDINFELDISVRIGNAQRESLQVERVAITESSRINT